MIKKSDKLFDFIQAMTSHERGYFKQSSNKDSYYVILFDAICKQKEYDEAGLARELKKRGCNRKISAMKDYLWRELTQAMAPYHLIKTPLGEAMAQMQSLHLIHGKGLTGHVNKELAALKKFCEKFELYDTLLHALQFEFRFGFHQLSLNDNYWQQFHDVVYANMVYMQLSEIQHRLHLLVLKQSGQHYQYNQREQDEIKHLVAHPVLSDPILKGRVRLQIIREAILDLHAQLRNDYEAIVKHNMSLVSLLESKPHLIKDGREISLIYTNIVIALADAGRRKQLAGIIDDIIERLHAIPHHQLYSLGRELEVKVIRMLTLNDYAILDDLVALFREHLNVIPVSIKHNLYFNIAVSYLKSGQIHNTLDWINDAFNFYRTHKRTDDAYVDTLKVIHLLLHYEMGNYLYVKNQLDSFMRVYKPVNKDKDLNYITLKHLKSAIRATEPVKEFKKLKERLNKDFKSNTNTIYFNISQWVESIITKTPYMQLCGETAYNELNSVGAANASLSRA